MRRTEPRPRASALLLLAAVMGLAACTGDTPDGEESAEPTVEEILAQDERFDAPALTAEDRDEMCAAVAAALADHYDTGEVPEFTTEIYIPQGTEADSGCGIAEVVWRRPDYRMDVEIQITPLTESDLLSASRQLGDDGPATMCDLIPGITGSLEDVESTEYCSEPTSNFDTSAIAYGRLLANRTTVQVQVSTGPSPGQLEQDWTDDLSEEPDLFVAGAETGLEHIMVAIQGFLANR